MPTNEEKSKKIGIYKILLLPLSPIYVALKANA